MLGATRAQHITWYVISKAKPNQSKLHFSFSILQPKIIRVQQQCESVNKQGLAAFRFFSLTRVNALLLQML